MNWHWKPIKKDLEANDVVDTLNPQMKALEGAIMGPSFVAGYPEHRGAVVDQTTITVGATTTETTVKSLTFERGILGANGGFRVTAGGNCGGAGGTKAIIMYWGGVAIATLSVAAGTRSWSITAEVWNADNAKIQRVLAKAYDSTGLETMAVTTSTVDTS